MGKSCKSTISMAMFNSFLLVYHHSTITVPSSNHQELCWISPKELTQNWHRTDTSRSAKPLKSWATCVEMKRIWISRSTAHVQWRVASFALNRLNKARNVFLCFFARQPWQNPPIQPSTSSSRWPCGWILFNQEQSQHKSTLMSTYGFVWK